MSTRREYGWSSSHKINHFGIILTLIFLLVSGHWLLVGNQNPVETVAHVISRYMYISGNWLVKTQNFVETFPNITSHSKPKCRITMNWQTDGLGHNLNSLMSLLNLHGRSSPSGKSEIYYDATFRSYSMYYNKSRWYFAHFGKGSKENDLAFAYFDEVQEQFAEYYGQSPLLYSKVIPPLRDSYRLYYEEPCKEDWLYPMSHAYWFVQERYPLIRRFFVDHNKLLPPSRLNQQVHSMVIHVRRDDGAKRYNYWQVFLALGRIIRIIHARYLGDLEIYIHTDGSPDFIKNNLGSLLPKKKIIIAGRNDSTVLQVISDMAHCDTFIGTPASLSYLGSHLTKAKNIFGAGKPASDMMPPRTKDLHDYLDDICLGHWPKCNGDDFMKTKDLLWVGR